MGPPPPPLQRAGCDTWSVESGILAAQLAVGTVVDGKLVVESAELHEGAVVTILSRGATAGLGLNREQEDELLDALAEIDRGESVTLEELLASLPKRR